MTPASSAPLRLLVSYHYHRRTDLSALTAAVGGNVDLFADSGAYSAATTGTEIKIADYAAWLTDWAPLFTTTANLDVIGDPAATAANHEWLQDAGLNPLPVFHATEPWAVLEKLCADHPYVALGGIARFAQRGTGQLGLRPLMRWLVRAFLIARDNGTVFHAFGMTSAKLIRDLPFYSTDSSSYAFGQRWGLAYLWDARALAMRDCFIRNPAAVRTYANLLVSHGLSPAEIASPDYLRPGRENTRTERRTLAAASVRAYRSMEQSMVARHQVIPPNLSRYAEPGTKVYLAVSGASEDNLEPLRLGRDTAPS